MIGGNLESENKSPGKSSKELISNKIEGARKVFDAAKLRSVLQEQKELRNVSANQSIEQSTIS